MGGAVRSGGHLLPDGEKGGRRPEPVRPRSHIAARDEADLRLQHLGRHEGGGGYAGGYLHVVEAVEGGRLSVETVDLAADAHLVEAAVVLVHRDADGHRPLDGLGVLDGGHVGRGVAFEEILAHGGDREGSRTVRDIGAHDHPADLGYTSLDLLAGDLPGPVGPTARQEQHQQDSHDCDHDDRRPQPRDEQLLAPPPAGLLGRGRGRRGKGARRGARGPSGCVARRADRPGRCAHRG